MRWPRWLCALLFCPYRPRPGRPREVVEARARFDDASARLNGAAFDQVEGAVMTERAANDARDKLAWVTQRASDRAERVTAAPPPHHPTVMRDQIDALVARQERRDRDH